MQCNELESVLAVDDLGALSPEAKQHLTACSACRDLVADFSAIVVAAKHIPAEVNPPERVWVALRAKLQAEGIIREPQAVQAPVTEPSWWAGVQQFFRPRVLGAVAATLLVAAGSIYISQHRGSTTTNKPSSPVIDAVKTAPGDSGKPVEQQVSVSPPVVTPKPHDSGVQMDRTAVVPPQPRPSTRELKPSPTENASFGETAVVLSDTEGALPSRGVADNAMADAALHQNLRTLNEFIAECQARLKKNPQDQLTREYLNMAYQQKAELLNAIMESGRSEN
jgi:hypothetical protein